VPSEPTAQPPASTPTAGLTALEQEALDLINAERAAVGAPPLTIDPAAQAAAVAHSEDMLARGFFDHTNPDGQDAGDRLAAAGASSSGWAENIAMGQDTAQSVVEGWMNSPGHRDNILNPSYTLTGLAAVTGGDGPYWTQVFS
jgi:uncharacterized protein YkwD